MKKPALPIQPSNGGYNNRPYFKELVKYIEGLDSYIETMETMETQIRLIERHLLNIEPFDASDAIFYEKEEEDGR